MAAVLIHAAERSALAVDLGDKADIQSCEGMSALIQRVSNGLPLCIGHALRGDDDIDVIGGQQQEAVGLGQLRFGILLRGRHRFRSGSRHFLRGRFHCRGSILLRDGQLRRPCRGQQAQGHDQRQDQG